MQRAATPCSTPEPSVEILPSQLPHSSSPTPSAPNHFVKDGRVIGIGDCALFQSGNSPPFIGIILSFHQNYQNAPRSTTNLSVNWLYRPSDIKLSKGNLLEAAPNEVFYSFHKDIVPADSLLHPCKVSFLRKGAELKNGVSSFVCRRVYDIDHKRLWWLTDKNYTNERQAEVNKLLDKTQSEMNASSQQANSSINRQSKALNSPRAGQTGQDDPNGSNGSPSFKLGRKRPDPLTLQPIKRDPDPFASAIEEDNDKNNTDTNVDSVQSEISKITEMGGLMSVEAVEKLLNLMQSDRTERKLDLTGRVMLAGIIAGSGMSSTGTGDNEPLVKFVQMRGVAILDEWLQEAHKGTKEGEHNKAVEELLLTLLRALEKLPINLSALRMCNIGKSVNHLRGHKNLEVQKKARSLVDTWKRRVDAEMKANELKTGQVQLGASKSVQEADLSPNNSGSSFGSGKLGSVASKSVHLTRSSNGQNKKTGTGPVTRSGDIAGPDNNGIGHRIVLRLNSTRSTVSEDPLDSPVRASPVQGGKMKKNDVKEETAGSEEGSSDKCTETGTGSVPMVPSGDDLGMLASVATGEINKSDNKELVKEEKNDDESDKKEENYKDGKNNEEPGGADKSEGNKDEKETSNKPEGKTVISVKIEEANNKSENKEGVVEKEPVLAPPKKENTDDDNNDKKEAVSQKSNIADVAEGDASTSAAPESSTKVEFDLNEGIEPLEDSSDPGATSSATPTATQATATTYFSFLNTPFTPKVTVASPARGPFLSQENLLRPVRGSETGRVGSGPTSAFRPAEPRKGLEMSIGLTGSGSRSGSSKRPVLEFDLNVADERVLEEEGFVLDLNRSDADPGTSGFKGIDLNGPGLGNDEPGTTSTENFTSRNQFPRGGPIGMSTSGGNIQFLPQSTGLWFPQSGAYPVPATYHASGPFGGTNIYRGGPVNNINNNINISNNNNVFMYPGQSQNQNQNQNQSQSHFPFGFPPGTGSTYQSMVPTSQMVGAGLSLSQRPPFFIGLPEGSSRMPVGRPGAGLDLNAGPGAGSSTVESTVHVDQVLGGGKRKEPEGGWDRSGFSGSNKQFWQ